MINDNRIDWSGDLPLTPTGEIDHKKAREQRNYNITCTTRPIPVIPLNSENYHEVNQAVITLTQMLEPAKNKEIIYELKKLSTHCGMANRDSINFAMMLDDYLDDLAEYPLDLIAEACRKYRNSPDKEHDFFPRPGKLKAFLSGEIFSRKFKLRRLEKLLEVANNPPKLPDPPTAEEIKQQALELHKSRDALSAIVGKKKPSLSPAEERKRDAMCIEATYKDMLAEKMISEEQAKEMLDNLHSNYPDIFKMEQ